MIFSLNAISIRLTARFQPTAYPVLKPLIQWQTDAGLSPKKADNGFKLPEYGTFHPVTDSEKQ